ncbi:MAG: polysaccharide deacetylase family protein [Flaviramulus sp.]|nr:polysaccharide deacetylase family protein [Flaviramulus sp.]NNC50170.1 polysaccharide deacetylase family protein [Flaviramulus sp.]
MTFTPIKTPLIAKKLFPNYVWDIPTTKKVVYLTFDDGPTPEITNWTLNILKEYQAEATFFCIGNNVEKHPEIFENILNNGHVIGNHTQNHIKGWKNNTKDYLTDVNKAKEIISTKTNTNLFRPPYGQITPKQGKNLIELGYKIIMWDVLSFDWDKQVNKETCLNNVVSKTKEGSIIVFHDSLKASNNMKYALPEVLEYFSKKGYVFKALNL